jgi:hypothetical protein
MSAYARKQEDSRMATARKKYHEAERVLNLLRLTRQSSADPTNEELKQWQKRITALI